MIKLDLARPKMIEREKYTEDDYDEMLRETYGDVMVCGMCMDAAYVLREMDPVAYNCGFNDYQEYDEIYECPICREEHDDEEDATYCCQSRDIYECEVCGTTHEEEDDCIECETNCKEELR